jgi:hypothetical protein
MNFHFFFLSKITLVNQEIQKGGALQQRPKKDIIA